MVAGLRLIMSCPLLKLLVAKLKPTRSAQTFQIHSRTRVMGCDMSHPITTENQVKPLDIDYRDPRGVIVHVTGWNRDKQQVYFTRQNYPHECMQPVWKFQQYFTKVSEAQNA